MPTEWVDMVLEATGQVGRVPNKPNVVAARRAKGWRLADEKPSARPKPRSRPVVTDGDDDSTEETDDA